MTRRIAALSTVLLLLVAAGCGSRRGGSEETSTAVEFATVDRVVDGDTVDLIIEGALERVRLIGIDTPESVSRNTPDQCFGDEATDALVGLLPPGTPVRIERDEEPRDRYQRLLLYIHREEDDLFVNLWLVENGFADAVSYQPNTTYEAVFNRAKNTAEEHNLGLWAACDGPDQPLE